MEYSANKARERVLFADIRSNPYNFPEPLNSPRTLAAYGRIGPHCFANRKSQANASGSWRKFERHFRMKIFAWHLEASLVTRPTFQLPFIRLGLVPPTATRSYRGEPYPNTPPIRLSLVSVQIRNSQRFSIEPTSDRRTFAKRRFYRASPTKVTKLSAIVRLLKISLFFLAFESLVFLFVATATFDTRLHSKWLVFREE